MRTFPSPLRRAAGLLAAGLAAVPLLAPAGRADSAGERLLQEAIAAYGAAKSLTAEITLVKTAPGPDGPKTETSTGRLWLQKPNLARLELTRPERQLFVSTGTELWTDYLRRDLVSQRAAPANGRDMFPHFLINAFFGARAPGAGLPGDAEGVRAAGTATVVGTPCEVIEFPVRGNEPGLRVFLGPDRLIRRTEERPADPNGVRTEVTLADVKCDGAIPEGTFVYRYVDPNRLAAPADKNLLPIGELAPDFTLNTYAGKKLSLKDALQGKKALVLLFWYSDCPPCREELPELQKLYAALKDRGMGLVAVNTNDTRDKIDAIASSERLTFPIVLDREGAVKYGTKERYGVSLFPANYVLDPDGRIIYRSSGTALESMRAALERLGVY